MKSENKNYYTVKNNDTIKLDSIPVLNYSNFSTLIIELLEDQNNHCVNYFAYPTIDKIKLIACIANDNKHNILIFAHEVNNTTDVKLESLTPEVNALHIFEREIYENYGIFFINHPWLKPVRYANNRANKEFTINNYPFYKINNSELHEIAVGPIHAGIIEPGHFRFICNGENVLHLEIQRGWQHRGVENLIVDKKTILQKTILSESIAGDTAIGHSLAFAQAIESLANQQISEQLSIERTIALELERIAIHVGDISALCTDVAYSLGSSIFGILRTGIINFTQSWCGNRLGKGMIRVGGTNHNFTEELKNNLLTTLSKFEKQFNELAEKTYKLPSIENRFDDIGTLTSNQIKTIGAVGMVARMANVNRDIRESHPFAGYSKYTYNPVVLHKGDVYSRFLLRKLEIEKSISWIRNVLANENFDQVCESPSTKTKLSPDSITISLTEGWRGEICHSVITNDKGEIVYYKIKDPSIHNWKALELSLRNLEISDFPINNKSYNLSYCGSDL